MDPLKKAHEAAMKNAEKFLNELFEKDPTMKNQIECNLRTYGTMFLSGSQGALWREDIPGKVTEILNKEIPDQLVEIKAYPEDPDGHHCCVEYNILVEDEDGSLITAYEKEKKRRKAI